MHVRTGLWMATLAAMTHNPILRAVRDRLRAKRKPSKVVTTACLRKLLVILNAMVRDGTAWQPATP